MAKAIELKSEYVDSMVLKLNTANKGEIYLAIWFSDNEAACEGCDACIGYGIYDMSENEIDGGEMDYDSEAENYDNISDTIDDILDFALGDDKILSIEETDIDAFELGD